MNALIKTCSNPVCPYGKTFMIPEKHFNKNKSKADGYSHYCKKCATDSVMYHLRVHREKTVCKRDDCGRTFMSTGHKKFCCKKCRATWHTERLDAKTESQRKQKYMKKVRKTQGKKNPGKIWTEKEIIRGANMKIDGKTWIEISSFLGRSLQSSWKHINPEVKRLRAIAKGEIK